MPWSPIRVVTSYLYVHVISFSKQELEWSSSRNITCCDCAANPAVDVPDVFPQALQHLSKLVKMGTVLRFLCVFQAFAVAQAAAPGFLGTQLKSKSGTCVPSFVSVHEPTIPDTETIPLPIVEVRVALNVRNLIDEV